MKSNRKIITLTMVLVVFGLVFNTAASIFAANGSGTTTVNVSIMASTDKVKDLIINGEPSNPADTYNAQNLVEFDILGKGTLTILDSEGNVIWTIEKVDEDWTHYEVPVDLPEIGSYDFTLQYSLDDGSVVELPFIINYLALPLPPATGTNPSLTSHYTYIGGYAISTLDLAIFAAILISLGILIFFWVRNEQDSKKQPVVANIDTRTKARVIKTKSAPKKSAKVAPAKRKALPKKK